MENISISLILIAIVGIAVGLVSAIVKKVKRKPVKKSFGLAGVSFVIFIAAAIALPEPSVEQQIGGLPLSGTYLSATKDRKLVFDGKIAALYENGKQIQTGTYEYHGERSINIVYQDFAELLIYTVDTKEILYQGNSNAVNFGEVEYFQEGVENPDLTALDIEYPLGSIYYNGGQDQAAVASDSDNVADDTSNEKHEEPESVSSESKQDVQHGDDAEYIGADLWLKESTDFLEGRAWIQFRESHRKKGSVDAANDAVDAALGNDTDRLLYGLQNYNAQGDNRAALIDTQGKILWESELTKKDYVLREKSEFRDGLAYCIFDGNDKSSYIILDSDGTATFTRDYEEDYRILGHGGGLLLVAEHTANFDTNEWKIGAIDKNGNTVVPFQTYEKNPSSRPSPVEPPDDSFLDSAEVTNAQINEAYQEWQSIARDINNRAIEITAEDKEALIRAKEKYDELLKAQEKMNAYEEYLQDKENYDSYTPEYISFDSEHDYLSCEYLGENIYALRFIGQEILLNIKARSVIYTYESGRGDYIRKFISNFENGSATVLYAEGMNYSVCSLGTDGTLTQIASNDWIQYQFHDDMEFSDGLIFAKDGSAGAYYNMMGEKVIDFPQYHGKNAYQCYPFYSGYAAMLLKGADGLVYITAINKNGDLMFEPKSGFDAVYTSRDGKYVTASKNGHITVFDINGYPLVSINYVGINLQQRYYEYTDHKYNVCDGVIKAEDFYVNVEDGTVIGLHGDSDTNYSITQYQN